VSLRNIFRPTRNRRAPGLALAFAAAFLAAAAAGCGPKYTYPADTVPEAIEQICLKEYKLDVEARVVGKTVGAMVMMDVLMDDKGQISKEAHEVMGKVLMVVSNRVALSTDLPLDFAVVILRDKAGNEISLTRAVDDTKRASAEALSIEESINRTLFTPRRYNVNDPSFVLKDVRLEEFLTEQITQRIRYSFTKDPGSEDEPMQQPFLHVDGAFDDREGRRVFRFSAIGVKPGDDPYASVLEIFKIVNKVLSGYRFSAFDAIEIQDYLNRLKLVLDRETLLEYQQKKISETQLLERCLIESQSIQEAFKMFGFNLGQD
jgi:hypothetical protein